MINYVKILAKSDALEEQRFKAYFEVNICDKEKADEFVKIFGKINGSGFQLDKKAKRRQDFISSIFVDCRKGKVDQGRRKGVERQKGKGSNCQAQITTNCSNVPTNINRRMRDHGRRGL